VGRTIRESDGETLAVVEDADLDAGTDDLVLLVQPPGRDAVAWRVPVEPAWLDESTPLSEVEQELAQRYLGGRGEQWQLVEEGEEVVADEPLYDTAVPPGPGDPDLDL